MFALSTIFPKTMFPSVQKTFQEEFVPYAAIRASDKPRYVKNRITKKLERFVAVRQNLFERVYPIRAQLAEKLIDAGYLHYSKFGKFCPVSVCFSLFCFFFFNVKPFSCIMVIAFRQHSVQINQLVLLSIENMCTFLLMTKHEMNSSKIQFFTHINHHRNRSFQPRLHLLAHQKLAKPPVCTDLI